MTVSLGANIGTPQAATPAALVDNFFKDGKDTILARDSVAAIVNAQIGDTVVLGTFRSTARIYQGSKLWWGAFGAGVKLNIGDSVHPTGLSNQIDVSAAGTGDLWTGYAAGSLGQPLWKALGYGSDPGGTLTLLGTFAAAASTVTKALDWNIVGVNR